MLYRALATDYDGTLAERGAVDSATLDALRRLRDTGRKILLVTGRELEELHDVFPEVGICDCVVAENGALLYWPASGEIRPLATAPPLEFIEELRRRGVDRMSVGRVVVAAWRPADEIIETVIHRQRLDLRIIYNKQAAMVLPGGIDKGSGLRVALAALGLAPADVVAVGDAENDRPLFTTCGYAVAVANALPELKPHADLITNGERGAGVRELIERLLDGALGPVSRQP